MIRNKIYIQLHNYESNQNQLVFKSFDVAAVYDTKTYNAMSECILISLLGSLAERFKMRSQRRAW